MDIIRVIDDWDVRGIRVQVVEARYEFGTHYVMLTNGMPGFHSTDLERVQNHAKRSVGID